MYAVALMALFVCLCDGQGRPQQVALRPSDAKQPQRPATPFT
jgi:hypothetical protein